MTTRAEGGFESPASTVVYTLSTGDHQVYPLDYPELGRGSPAWGPYQFTQTVYDPSFSRVVYAAGDDVSAYLALWDIAQERLLANYRVFYREYGGLPRWTNDGSQFIAGIQPVFIRYDGVEYPNIESDLPYIGGYDLFKVTRDGKPKRLTYLTTQYRAAALSYTLSPDERHLAFWLTLDHEVPVLKGSFELAILAIDTGQITNLCIQQVIEEGQIRINSPSYPVWSPDGNHLMVTIFDPAELKFRVVMVNIIKRTGYVVKKDAIGVGWLVPLE